MAIRILTEVDQAQLNPFAQRLEEFVEGVARREDSAHGFRKAWVRVPISRFVQSPLIDGRLFI
jgi:hypothetical protein